MWLELQGADGRDTWHHWFSVLSHLLLRFVCLKSSMFYIVINTDAITFCIQITSVFDVVMTWLYGFKQVIWLEVTRSLLDTNIPFIFLKYSSLFSIEGWQSFFVTFTGSLLLRLYLLQFQFKPYITFFVLLLTLLIH